MQIFKIYLASSLFALSFFSCSTANLTEEKKKEPVIKSNITDTTSFSNKVHDYSNTPGILGVINIPEMLVMSITDSTDVNRVSMLMEKNYETLAQEIKTIGAETNGSLGMISYNNDLRNFVFETVSCIKQIPKVQPKKSKIVILESSSMLIYNFYGSYQNLFAAYGEMKNYCAKNGLTQNGPMREFYLTGPGIEKDPKKWLTRIMLPVISQGNN
jgi:effector-binding domain-containing protein